MVHSVGNHAPAASGFPPAARAAPSPARKDPPTTNPPHAAGLAALAVCESMLLSLAESKVLAAAEARAILEDAAATTRNAGALLPDGAGHAAAAELIEAILAGVASARFD